LAFWNPHFQNADGGRGIYSEVSLNDASILSKSGHEKWPVSMATPAFARFDMSRFGAAY